MVLPLTQLLRSIFEYSFGIFFLKSQLSGRAFNRYTERSILVSRTDCFYFQCYHLTANNHFLSFIQDTILLYEGLV